MAPKTSCQVETAFESRLDSDGGGLLSAEIKTDIIQLRRKLTLCDLKDDWKVVNYKTLPDWMKNNPNILYGNRPQLNSYRLAIKSLFKLHHETGNIWSHLFGALTWAYLGVEFFTSEKLMPSNVHIIDKAMIGIWFIGQVICCLLSTLYHTFNCHSMETCHRLVRCDYIGIFTSCWVTLLTAGYFSYYCDYGIRLGWYWVASLILLIGPKMVLTENNFLRVVIYSIVVLPTIAAFYVAIVDVRYYHPEIFVSCFVNLIGTYGYPLSGAFLYLKKIPEKYWPGKFDYFGHSHQLMHILVLGCMYCQYNLLVLASGIRFSEKCSFR